MIRQPAGSQPAALPIELHPQSIRQDSNLRLPVCGTGVLPLSY